MNLRVSVGRNAYLVFALLARIKLGALVDVIAACIAADAHRKHHPHLDVLICGLLPAWDLHRVEVWGVILSLFTHRPKSTLNPRHENFGPNK